MSDIDALRQEASGRKSDVTVFVTHDCVDHHDIWPGWRNSPKLLACDWTRERHDLRIEPSHIASTEEGAGPERQVLLTGAEPIPGYQFRIIDDLYLAGFGRAAKVAGEPEILKTDIGRLDPTNATCTDEQIRLIGVDDAYDGQITSFLTYQLMHECDGALIDGETAKRDAVTVCNCGHSIGQRT